MLKESFQSEEYFSRLLTKYLVTSKPELFYLMWLQEYAHILLPGANYRIDAGQTYEVNKDTKASNMLSYNERTETDLILLRLM